MPPVLSVISIVIISKVIINLVVVSHHKMIVILFCEYKMCSTKVKQKIKTEQSNFFSRQMKKIALPLRVFTNVLKKNLSLKL